MTDDANRMFWDTTPLYASAEDPAIEKDLEEAKLRGREFRERYAGKTATLAAGELFEALVAYERLQELILKPQLYAHLLFAADSGDDAIKRLSQRTAEFGNLMGRELLFFDLKLMEIGEEEFARLFAADSRLDSYRHFLEIIRKFRPFTLSEREEQLLKLKDLTGTDAFNRLFDEITASFRYRFELDGETREMTGEDLLGLLHHGDAEVRERAFSTFLKRQEEQGVVFSAVFNTVALDHRQEMDLRGYSAPIQPTNLGNEIPDQVVERMMEVSEANYPLARDYFRLKAKLLGMDRLKNSDIYAPVGGVSRTYTFDESRDLVLESFGAFSPRFRDLALPFFKDCRIDVLPRPGKTGGAFCMGMTPSLPPYLLLNHIGNLRDVTTLAHELGHGLHFVLASKQSMLNYFPPLPLAETASVFGEMLLTRMLLERENDRQVKISLLCASIEDIIATTFRQNVLTRFEERMHLERQKGLITTSHLCDLWWEENDKLYGDSVEMIPSYRWGWSYISHFIHTRFYCYAYTFAELLVLALFEKYLKEGESFIPVYEEILESGGSKSPADTVRQAGIDLADPGFWQQGYDLLAELIEELKRLVD